jgi:hypothetical protein
MLQCRERSNVPLASFIAVQKSSGLLTVSDEPPYSAFAQAAHNQALDWGLPDGSLRYKHG